MSMIATLHNIEMEIVSYADEAGKSVESIGAEIIDFIINKKVETQNAKAANSMEPKAN